MKLIVRKVFLLMILIIYLSTFFLVDEDPPILMVSKPHAHSHGVRSITFVAALSFHSIVEGVALGITVLRNFKINNSKII